MRQKRTTGPANTALPALGGGMPQEESPLRPVSVVEYATLAAAQPGQTPFPGSRIYDEAIYAAPHYAVTAGAIFVSWARGRRRLTMRKWRAVGREEAQILALTTGHDLLPGRCGTRERCGRISLEQQLLDVIRIGAGIRISGAESIWPGISGRPAMWARFARRRPRCVGRSCTACLYPARNSLRQLHADAALPQPQLG